jgi:hypothetical protein
MEWGILSATEFLIIVSPSGNDFVVDRWQFSEKPDTDNSEGVNLRHRQRTLLLCDFALGVNAEHQSPAELMIHPRGDRNARRDGDMMPMR